MPRSIAAGQLSAIERAIDDACSNGVLPNANFVVVNKKGEQLVNHYAGVRNINTGEPINAESIYGLASCTKLITAIASLQLVEQGKLKLDDIELAEKLCPELKDVKVVQDDGSLVPKKRGITLRMLLSHTSGFGYTLTNRKLINYLDLSGDKEKFMTVPLVNQPGETYEYGGGIDWAGILVERATGMELNDYFQKYIMQPLGIKITMVPTDETKSKLVQMHSRDSDGKLHEFYQPYFDKVEAKMKAGLPFFQSGGVGTFGTTAEYMKILAMLLNDGVSAETGNRLLSRETVKEMFTNQIPDIPDFGRLPMDNPFPQFWKPIDEWYRLPNRDPQGWGLSFMMTHSPTGRSAVSGCWYGASGSFYWVDKEREIAGLLNTQVVPFRDEPTMKLWVELETLVYKGLQHETKL